MISRKAIPKERWKTSNKYNNESFLCYDKSKLSQEAFNGPSEKVFRIEALQNGQYSIMAVSIGRYLSVNNKILGLKRECDESCYFILYTQDNKKERKLAINPVKRPDPSSHTSKHPDPLVLTSHTSKQTIDICDLDCFFVRHPSCGEKAVFFYPNILRTR